MVYPRIKYTLTEHVFGIVASAMILLTFFFCLIQSN